MFLKFSQIVECCLNHRHSTTSKIINFFSIIPDMWRQSKFHKRFLFTNIHFFPVVRCLLWYTSTFNHFVFDNQFFN